MSNPKIAIIMGSQSDLETMSEAVNLLKEFGAGYEVRVLSAHRTPEEVAKFAKDARKNGIKVIIAGAGGAAALAGVIAAHTTLPVIGVPIETSSLNGLDSLLSTVQMLWGRAGSLNGHRQGRGQERWHLCLGDIRRKRRGYGKEVRGLQKSLAKKVKEIKLNV